MNFSKKGLVATIAYSTPFSWLDGSLPHAPKRTSVCPLFWRFWFKLLFVWSLPTAFLCLSLSIVIVSFSCTSWAALLFAHRIAWEDDRLSLVPFIRWPAIWGHRIWPLWLVAIAMATSHMQGMQTLLFLAYLAACIVSALLVLVALSIVYDRLVEVACRKNSVIQLCAAWGRAIKNRICPVVTFTDDK